MSDRSIPVDIGDDRTVGHLKDEIVKKNPVSFQNVDAYELDLWKTSFLIDRQLKNQVSNHQFLEDNVLLEGVRLSKIFPPPGPAEETLHIVVRHPRSPTITASRSSDSNIAAYIALKRSHPDDPDDLDGIKRARLDEDAWLTELHGKIWGRKDRWLELHHTVEVTAAHYHELQDRLNKLCPDRQTREYQARSEGVLSTKLELLRNFKPPSVTPTPEPIAHTDNEQVKNDEEEENNDDDGPCSLFPFTLEYLDLSCLQLESRLSHMPLALFIRNEYHILNDIVNRLQGSGIISGQPGTGKTSYIHFRMVVSMIKGESFLYQSLGGTVYHVSDIITAITSWPSGSEVIVAYVDADAKKFEPQMFLRRPQVKIIAASSQRGTKQPWLKQMGNYRFPLTFVTALWTDQELFVTGIFLHPADLTYARLKEATIYFGFSPRLCFNASLEVFQLRHLQNEIEMAVHTASLKRDIGSLIVSYPNSIMLSHTIFELSPGDDDRLFGDALIGAVSSWALDLLLGAYETQKSDAAAEFYDSISHMPKAGSLRGRIFERQVLKYLDNLEEESTFSIRSLEDSTITKWVYPGPAKLHGFLPTTFAQELLSAVENKTPLHLVPKDPNFPALDSIIYDPSHGLTHTQVTTRVEHPVGVSGFKRIQGHLKRNTPLADLRPSIRDRHWPLIFMVPDAIAASFKKQPFEGDTVKQEWANKVDQYVLGIKENSLWARTK